jgi:putative phage-type endonuclease
MKSDLIITRIPVHSKEWHAFRRNGIGGSEVGDICGLVKKEYNRTIYHFHNKVGDVITEIPDNPKMFFGRYFEDSIADLWRYYDGSEQGFIENYKNNRIIRDCRKVNGFVVNPKYPWLFASIDRLMNVKGGRNLITGDPLTTEAILECKQLSYNASRQWEDGIPPSYIGQVHTYMIVMETDYAELAILKDGNELIIEKVKRDEGLCESILGVTKAFWENRILPAKEAYAKMCEAEKVGNIGQVEKWDAEMQLYEPEPDGSDAYMDFLNSKFLKERESIQGTMKTYDLCKQDKVLLGITNIIGEKRDLIKNILVNELTKGGAEIIDFGRLGSYKWTERKGSKNRTPMNGIKEKPTEEQLMQEFLKINQECY